MRLLIIDNEARFVEVLREGLLLAEFQVDMTNNADEALEMIGRRYYSVAIVDLNLPDDGGRRFLEQYREIDPLLAVIILTAAPAGAAAVEFLRGGSGAMALDYIHKPEPQMLERLTKAIDDYGARLELGEFRVDRRLRQAYWNGEPFELTGRELVLLMVLMQHPEGVGYVELAKAVYGEPLDHDEAVARLSSNLSRLRRKLKEVTGRDVVTAWAGDGYRLLTQARRDDTLGEDTRENERETG